MGKHKIKNLETAMVFKKCTFKVDHEPTPHAHLAIAMSTLDHRRHDIKHFLVHPGPVRISQAHGVID